jgi:hypothetical protein
LSGERVGEVDETHLPTERSVGPSVEDKEIKEEVPVSMEKEVEDKSSIPEDEPIPIEAEKLAEQSSVDQEEPDSSSPKEPLSYKDETTAESDSISVLDEEDQGNQTSPVQEPEENEVSNLY